MSKTATLKVIEDPHRVVLQPLKPVRRDKCEKFASVAEMVSRTRPELPVHCLRPHTIKHAAKWFLSSFPGKVMYSVKSNPDPKVLSYLWAAGVRHYDIASVKEIELVAGLLPRAKMYYMHPVKSREAIYRAYFMYGVRTFSLDSLAELKKIQEVTEDAQDLELFIRVAIPNEHAAYSLSGKFGVQTEEAVALLKAARGVAGRLGVCFHVGSQCMDPMAYRNAMLLVKHLAEGASVKLDVLDIGGGFPSIYPGMTPPALPAYMESIKDAMAELGFAQDVELFCEPGRALVAEGGSLVVRVELRKNDTLYINDGTYGTLFDAGHPGFTYPVRGYRPFGQLSEKLIPFSFFGPTCDSLDAMKGPFMLPKDINEGDFIEVGQLGAYGATLQTGFNGFYSDKRVEVADEPILSLFRE